MTNDPLISQLKESGQASMDTDRAARMRRETLAAFDRVPFDAPIRQAPLQWLSSKRLVTAALAAIILTFGFSTTAMANAARPGDFLFGWDQAAERLRLALTFGSEAKAKYEARVAEERVRERLELEAKNSSHATASVQLSDKALHQALESVIKARAKAEHRPGRAYEALGEVETRLRALRNRNTANGQTLEVRAEVRSGLTKIEVHFGEQEWKFTTTATAEEDIIRAIIVETGLPDADIRAALQIDIEQRDDDQEADEDDDRRADPTTDANRDQSDDESRNVNQNTNRRDTDDDDADGGAEIEVESDSRIQLERDEQSAEIKFETSGQSRFP